MQRSLALSEVGDPPMSLENAKLHLRIYHAEDDDDIIQLLREAYGITEQRTGRMIRTATAVLTMSAFPVDGGQIVLPRPPVTAVTSVQYYDPEGELQGLADCQVALSMFPGLISLPLDSFDWPATAERLDAVRITYTCGGSEPEQLRSAVRLLLDMAYNDMTPAKAAQVEKRIDGLLHGYTLRDPRLYGITT